MKSTSKGASSPVPWARVAVFVSSTFSDMHAERDYLVKRVFPDLQDWCERRRLRLVDIDLRWGVTEEDATQNKNVVQTCLKRIDECRPFFLCFVGQRRGWVPMPEEVDPRTLEAFPDLRQHIGKASVTELEILHAILRPLHGNAPRDPARDPDYYSPAERAFFYLRAPSYLNDVPANPPDLLVAYTNAGGDDPARRAHDDEELKRWREVEIPKSGRPVCDYSAKWNRELSTPELALPMVCPATVEAGRERWRNRWARAGVELASDGLRVADESRACEFNRSLIAGRLSEFRLHDRELADVILDDLKRAITARYPDHVEVEGKPGSLQAELDQQEQFLFVNSEGFIERGNDFDELNDYVRSDSRKLFVLTAEGGMGKSMLLANWMDRCRAEGSPLAGTPFLFRFVGQSDGSTTASNVMASILHELRDVHGLLPATVRVKEGRPGPSGAASEKVEREVPLEIPGDPNKLLEFWREWLPKVAAKGKCVIVIDALNQLTEGLEHIHWLPQGELPAGLKFIVSFRRGAPGSERLLETWREPYYADKVQLSEVRPFTEKAHRRALVDAYLDQYLKALDDHLIEELVSVEGAANPLFLKIVLSELRVFGSFEQLAQKIRTDFGTDPVSAVRAVLRRLISDPAYSPLPSVQVVPLVFGTLASARGGLSVAELSDILCRSLGQIAPTEDQLRKAREAVLVALRQERPFLARRDGSHDFFYESFQTAAREAFCLDGVEDQKPEPSARPGKEWHSLIADHFAAQPNTNRRRVSELPHHLTCAERWDDLIGKDETPGPLSDLLFIQAKCEAGLVYELVTDFNAALAALPEFREENERNRRRDAAMIAYNKALREYAVVRCDWWFAKERGDIRPEPDYPPLPEELRDDSKVAIPAGSSLRAARLRHFANFVSGHLAALEARPEDSLAVAWNAADGGTVCRQAETLIPSQHSPWLRRTHRPPQPPLRPQCLTKLEGHADSVFSVSVRTEGRCAVLGSSDKSLRVWDLETGQCLRTLEGHEAGISSVSVSADGQRTVSASWDKTLRVWDFETGQCLSTLEGHEAIVSSVSVSPDGRRAVSGSDDRTLRIWDLETGRCLRKLQCVDKVYCVIVSPDGRRVISSSWDKTLRVFDLETGQCLRTIKRNAGSVERVCVSPDGRRAVSGGHDKTLRVWDLETGQNLCTIHASGVFSLSPDGRRVVSGGDGVERTLRVWDLETGQCLQTLERHATAVCSLQLSPDGRRAVSGGNRDDMTTQVWNLETGPNLCMLEGHAAGVRSVSVRPDGRRAVSGSYDDTLRVWNLETGQCLRTFYATGVFCLSPNGRRAVSGGNDANLRVWDLRTGKLLCTLFGQEAWIESVGVSPDGRHAVSGTAYSLKVWDLYTGQCLRTLICQAASVESVSVCPDGRRAVSGSSDKTLLVWDLEISQCLHTLEGHTSRVRSVSVSPDGRRAVSGSEDKTLRIWDLETGHSLRTLDGHADGIYGVSVSHDGRRAISGSWDKTLRVWDLESGTCIAAYHAGACVGSVAFSPKGDYIVCGTSDGQMHFLTPVNFPPCGPPIIVPIRLWQFGKFRKKEDGIWNRITRLLMGRGCWSDHLICRCAHCGKLFVPPEPILEIGRAGAQVIRKGLWLPDSAYADPRLLASCPHCGGALKFNPFVVDNAT